MASTVKEKHIANLRAARYLAADIAHRLPDAGQVIPTPGPHERVVFVAHFVRGLGFPLHPFVRGLMFYYGLDFHDLAPNFVLNISAFIVVCEAFLRIRPHFSLWLQTFCVKPKVVSGQQAECGGAMVGRMPNVTWLDGSFVETVKGWQSGWFYITEPRGTNWAVPPNLDPKPHAAHLLGKEGPILGRFYGADRTPDMHQKHEGQEHRACQRDPGHARSPDPALPEAGSQSVGVRPGRTSDAPEALQHDTQRRMEGVVQGLRSSSSHIRGPRASRRVAS